MSKAPWKQSKRQKAREMKERLAITDSQMMHRVGPIIEQLEGCKSDEARRLIIHGIPPRSQNSKPPVK
jgi:hypothetical protein